LHEVTVLSGVVQENVGHRGLFRQNGVRAVGRAVRDTSWRLGDMPEALDIAPMKEPGSYPLKRRSSRTASW
jgi:hypothetical protein